MQIKINTFPCNVNAVKPVEKGLISDHGIGLRALFVNGYTEFGTTSGLLSKRAERSPIEKILNGPRLLCYITL
jgi:hypothetical protein